MPTQTDAVPVRSYIDGPRITVDTFLKDPLKINELVFAMSKQQFIADALLRSAGPVGGGSVMYHDSTPLYADSDAQERAEFGEVPVAVTSRGVPHVTYVRETALAIMVSDEMRRRMNVDPVNQQLQQVKNTLVKSWDKAFLDALSAAVTQSVSAEEGTWDSDGGTASDIRQDIIAAQKLVATATVGGQDTAYGFKADTMVLSEGRAFDILAQEDFNKPYVGNMADENLLYVGKLPNKILGLNVVTSRTIDDYTVYVMQRRVSGFIADELPLQTSALYRDEPRKSWRADVQRASAIAIDQPLSAAKIAIAKPNP